MDMFYVRENTGRILNQKEYDNVPHHNPATDNYIVLGKFESRTKAKKYYTDVYSKMNVYLDEKEGVDK